MAASFSVSRHIKCGITVQRTNKIKCTRYVEGHGGKRKLMSPKGEIKKRNAIVTACRTDFLKALGTRSRARCNSIANRQMEWMLTMFGPSQRANEWFRGDTVVRSCSNALKCMALRFEGCSVWLIYLVVLVHTQTQQNSAQKLSRF